MACVFCKRQNSDWLSERCKEETFLKTGYKNWKKATEKLDKHQQFTCHKSALTYEVIVPQCRNAPEMIDENEKKYRELNRRIFLTILETLQYLSRQGLAVRGDDDDESNFIQLLKLQSKKFPELTDWLSKKTERYTSHDVQNEIINLMSNQIMRNLLEPVRSCIFLVMCDEYTDVSNKEQLTFCVRWVNNDLEVSEKFLEFYEIQI